LERSTPRARTPRVSPGFCWFLRKENPYLPIDGTIDGDSPLRMIKLTETRDITPYLWVHPDEKR
jgi:hypothetical protein